MKFIIPGLTKTRRKGPPFEAFYSAFPEDLRICPAGASPAMQEKRLSGLHLSASGINRNPLFISVRKPHKLVKAATIGHWLKSVMHSAGIDAKVKERYREKLSCVGLSIQDDPYLPTNDARFVNDIAPWPRL